MKLREWLNQQGISDSAFAAQIGRHRSTIQRLGRDEMWPDRETVQLILEATGGAVTPNDFLGIADENAA